MAEPARNHSQPKPNLSEGPWPNDPEEVCDLVMKGGVTSGVVYPGAILRLAERYRFRNIGGTSAGAIAATVTAACEYGRREGGGGGLAKLREVAFAIGEPNFVLNLFQPRPETKRAYDLALRAVTSGKKGVPLVRELAADSLGRRAFLLGSVIALWLAALGFLAYALFTWIGWWAAIGWVFLLALAVFGCGGIVALALALIYGPPARALKRTLEQRGFGMCPGTSQAGFKDAAGKPVQALSDWLHERIQACAGRTTVQAPLTFADLEAKKGEDDSRCIYLQLMTTDLSAGRPVRLPLPDDDTNPFLFDPDELTEVIPEKVVEWMVEQAGDAVEIGGEKLYRLPGRGMPLLLATRLSLSFPMLLTAIPFYTAHENVPGGRVEHWFSDGGITSNFPIHFFDSLLPGHPTFGLDLMGAPNKRLAAVIDDENPDPTLRYVYLPAGATDPLPLRWSSVDGLAGFFKQMFDSARNWRDTMQMELPGFRERVCHIRLDASEGGLNLNMDETVVKRLVERGNAAGEKFRDFSFTRHQFTRYLTFMQLLQVELQRARERFGFGEGEEERWFRTRLAETIRDPAYPWSNVNDPAWCAQARDATQTLLDTAGAWGEEPPATIGFNHADQTPTPQPTIRITPLT